MRGLNSICKNNNQIKIFSDVILVKSWQCKKLFVLYSMVMSYRTKKHWQNVGFSIIVLYIVWFTINDQMMEVDETTLQPALHRLILAPMDSVVAVATVGLVTTYHPKVSLIDQSTDDGTFTFHWSLFRSHLSFVGFVGYNTPIFFHFIQR